MSTTKPFLNKGGEMGSLTRAFNWQSTAIGASETWSNSHLSAVNMMLTSRFPMLIFWGPELITFYNDAFRPSLGNEGKHPGSLGQPGHQSWAESWPVIGPMINNIMAGGDAVYFEDQKLPLYREGKMGYAYWTYSFSPLMDDDGSIGGVLVTCSETTAAVESKKKLEQQEQYLQMALRSADLGTWYMNASTREFVASNRLKEMFGFHSDEDMQYEAAVDQVMETHKSNVLEAVEAALKLGNAYDLEYPIIGYHDQQLRWVRATGQIFNDSEGNPVHFSGTVADITLRRDEEQRKQDFIGIVSHELKSPLTSLNGFLQILKLKASKADDQALIDLVVRAKRQSDKMATMIAGFLDVARSGESQIKLICKPFDMADMIENAKQELLARVTSHKLMFHPVEKTEVVADEDKIEQVLINLVNNAIKYSAQDSTIQIKCVGDGQWARVTILDEGIGISPRDRQQVFNRFFRVVSKATENVSGFGIGLYICKEIIERHNGHIGVDSELHKGSAFWFEIPLKENK